VHVGASFSTAKIGIAKNIFGHVAGGWSKELGKQQIHC
jgi:hypothetical protein